jgi:uncharacterized protein
LPHCSNGHSPVSRCSKCKTEQNDGRARISDQNQLHAPALEGKANTALRAFLAEELKISEQRIRLIRGQKSREKLIRVEGLSEKEVLRCLLTKA